MVSMAKIVDNLGLLCPGWQLSWVAIVLSGKNPLGGICLMNRL